MLVQYNYTTLYRNGVFSNNLGQTVLTHTTIDVHTRARAFNTLYGVGLFYRVMKNLQKLQKLRPIHKTWAVKF